MKVNKQIWEDLRVLLNYPTFYEMEQELFSLNYIYNSRSRNLISLGAIYTLWQAGVEADEMFNLLRKHKV